VILPNSSAHYSRLRVLKVSDFFDEIFSIEPVAATAQARLLWLPGGFNKQVDPWRCIMPGRCA
jgi:hypothetical protein